MKLLVRLTRERGEAAPEEAASEADEGTTGGSEATRDASRAASEGGDGPEDSGEMGKVESLTPREIEVLKLLSQGQTNPQIARNLLFSVSTVKAHVRSILAKLGVSDRTQAAVRAIEFRLTTD